MKRKFILAFATLLAVFLFQMSSFKLQSHVQQPLTGGLANNPGQSNCSSCHSAYGAPIVRNSQFIIRVSLDSAGLSNDSSIVTGTNSFYTPHHTQWVSVELTGTNTNTPGDTTLYGFQFTALKAAPNDSMAGSFTLVDPHTSMQTSSYNNAPTPQGTISYVSHYNPLPYSHTINTWYFQWSAPDSSSGPVTFYYSGNLGNGNLGGDPSNDYPLSDSIFVGSMTLYPGPSSTLGISNMSILHSISIYPVPFGQQLNADLYLNTSSNVSMTLLSIEGQTIKDLYSGAANQGHFSKSFDIGNIAPGIYFVRVQSGADSQTIKVLKN